MDLPTYTNIWRIEKRLYKLYDLRLPAPLPITWLAVFVAITVPYVVFLVAVGLPFNHTLVWLYVLPPAVLTWLTTRPVIEGKRLPELVTSQVRYMTEPRAWCRMAPFAEKDEISVSARVWHARPPKVRPKKALARARPGVPAPQAAGPNAADAPPPQVAWRAASPAVAAPASDPVVSASAHVRVPARASARPEATPVRAAPRAKLAWSPWPGGSAPETGAPESGGDHAPMLTARPAWMIALSHAAGTPESGTLEVSQDSEPLGDPGGPPTASSAPAAQAAQLLAGAPGTIIVTPSQLRGIRGWWRKLAPAAAALRELGFTGQTDQVAAIAYAIGAARFAVKIPCITCSTPTPVDVGIGDPGDPEPAGVVCSTCRTEIVPVGQEPGKQDQEAMDRDRARMPLPGPRRIAVLGCTRGAGQSLIGQMTGHPGLRCGSPVAAAGPQSGRHLAGRPHRTGHIGDRALLAGQGPDPRAEQAGGPAAAALEAGRRDRRAARDQRRSRWAPATFERLGRLLDERYPLTMIDPAPAGPHPGAVAGRPAGAGRPGRPGGG